MMVKNVFTTALVGSAIALPLACASTPRGAPAASGAPASAAQATATSVPSAAARAAPRAGADALPAPSTPPANRPAAPSSSASAAAAIPGVHIVPIARGWQDSDTGYMPNIDMVEGRAPDERHPAGTVLVAETRADRQEPATVTEWDLATGRELREVPLSAGADVRMVRAGGVVHAIVWSYESALYYVCLSVADFRVLNVERIGMVGPTGPAAIASDGRVTIVAAEGSLPNVASGLFVATFDQNGNRIAARGLQACKQPDPTSAYCGTASGSMRDDAVVVGGHPYVLLATDDENAAGRRYRLLRLRADSSTEREWSFRSSSFPDQLTLESWQRQLAVDGSPYGAPPQQILFSPEPREIARHASCADAPPPGATGGHPARHVWLGRVHVALYGLNAGGKAHLAWTEEADPGPRPPCWAALPTRRVVERTSEPR